MYRVKGVLWADMRKISVLNVRIQSDNVLRDFSDRKADGPVLARRRHHELGTFTVREFHGEHRMSGVERFILSSVNSADVSELGKVIVGEIFVFIASPPGGLLNPHEAGAIHGNFRYIAAVKILLQSFLELHTNRQVFFNGRAHWFLPKFDFAGF